MMTIDQILICNFRPDLRIDNILAAPNTTETGRNCDFNLIFKPALIFKLAGPFATPRTEPWDFIEAASVGSVICGIPGTMCTALTPTFRPAETSWPTEHWTRPRKSWSRTEVTFTSQSNSSNFTSCRDTDADGVTQILRQRDRETDS